jgi:hypothetical protein
LFSKTKFNKFSSVSALKNLELSDTIIFNENSKLKELQVQLIKQEVKNKELL